MKIALCAVLALAGLPTAYSSQDPANSTLSGFTEDPALLWSTYNPALYFAVRPRLPKSVVNGLMWLGLDWDSLQRIHHTASSSPPSESGLQSYTFTSAVPRLGSTQRLIDSRNGFTVNTAFANLKAGSEWGARVEVVGDHGKERGTGVWYVSLEGPGSLRLVAQEGEAEGLTSPIVLEGNTPDLGEFRITLTDHKDAQPITTGKMSELFEKSLGKTSWAGVNVPVTDIWKAKDIVASLITQTANAMIQRFTNGAEQPRAADLPDPAFVLGHALGNQRSAFECNFWAFQKSWEGVGGWDVIYEQGPFASETPDVSEDGKAPSITQALETLASTYQAHFAERLPLTSEAAAPYSSSAYQKFAQEVTANVFGGIGYFSGRSLIDRSFAQEYDEQPEYEEGEEGVKETEERQLLTASPSRSFFPRGFYWDEGFHLLIIGALDNDLSLEILKSWIDLIDEDGWVAREQILGEEARSRVPAEFRVQYPSYANPPTLAMAVTAFIARLKERESAELLNSQLGLDTAQVLVSSSSFELGSSEKYLDPAQARAYLNSIYPALRRHYLWFRHSQKGQLKEWGRKPPSRTEAYRWRGRTEKHVLTSGLDDYPRAVPPSVGELHLDLMCWMGFFARTMGEIAEYVGLEEDRGEYARNEKNILANLDYLHWSEEDQMYCDATVDDDDESVPVCHAGYISLFPLLTGILPASSPHLGAILELMRDPETLWSPYGIRSLAKNHPLFGKDENYWRGPIWMPFNYMALSSLYKIYMVHEGPHQALAKEIYTELRQNLITNIFKEYERTGFVWEQYDPLTGEGARSHPFTGWTAMVAMVMAEKY